MTILDAITTDPTAALLGAGGGATVLGGIVLLAREIVRARKHARNNAAQERVSTQEHDAIIAPKLLERIDAQDSRIESLSTALSESETRCAEKMDAALAEADRKCDERSAARVAEATAPLHEMITTLAGTMRRSMGPDDTGVHEVERIARRTPSQPMRAVSETMVPPSPGGESEEP